MQNEHFLAKISMFCDILQLFFWLKFFSLCYLQISSSSIGVIIEEMWYPSCTARLDLDRRFDVFLWTRYLQGDFLEVYQPLSRDETRRIFCMWKYSLHVHKTKRSENSADKCRDFLENSIFPSFGLSIPPYSRGSPFLQQLHPPSSHGIKLTAVSQKIALALARTPSSCLLNLFRTSE